jgi:hypothetical protein
MNVDEHFYLGWLRESANLFKNAGKMITRAPKMITAMTWLTTSATATNITSG